MGSQFITKESYQQVFVQVGTVLRPGIDTDQLLELIREEFDSDCQPNKKKLFNKKSNAAAAYDDEDRKPAAAQEQDDLAARPPPQNLD